MLKQICLAVGICAGFAAVVIVSFTITRGCLRGAVSVEPTSTRLTIEFKDGWREIPFDGGPTQHYVILQFGEEGQHVVLESLTITPMGKTMELEILDTDMEPLGAPLFLRSPGLHSWQTGDLLLQGISLRTHAGKGLILRASCGFKGVAITSLEPVEENRHGGD